MRQIGILPRACAVVFALLVFSSAARAQGAAGVHFGIGGGATFPLEDTKNSFDTGFHGFAALVYNSPAPLGLRFEGAYLKMERKPFPDLTGDVRIASGTANLVLGPRTRFVRPYFIGGGGAYYVRFRTDTIAGPVTDSQTEFGWNAGGGLDFSLGKASLFVEARYHRVSTEGRDFTFVPLSLGLTF